MFNSNFTKILGDKMNYTLLKEFEKYVDGKFDECISPVSVLPFLCSKYDCNHKSMLNDLSNDFDLKEITLNNTDDVINYFYLESGINNQNAFKFIFHEILDNIHEHSKFSHAFVLSRCYADVIDYCFLDDGISIQNSFENNNFSFENDCDAILNAVNGMSTKQISGFIERGYGLNNIVSLTSLDNNGAVLIASRNGMIYIDKNKIYKRKLSKITINGCIVALRLNVNQDFNNFYTLIDGHHTFEE